MEFPDPTIDVAAEAALLFAAGAKPFGERAEASARLRALFSQAWVEGRWSPPGVCANPYGAPAQPVALDPQEEWSAGEPLRQLRLAARAALAWVENMAPTVRRTALANQLRDALGGK